MYKKGRRRILFERELSWKDVNTLTHSWRHAKKKKKRFLHSWKATTKSSQQSQPDPQLVSGALVAGDKTPLGLGQFAGDRFLYSSDPSAVRQCLLLSDIWPDRSDQNTSWHLRVKGWFTGFLFCKASKWWRHRWDCDGRVRYRRVLEMRFTDCR